MSFASATPLTFTLTFHGPFRLPCYAFGQMKCPHCQVTIHDAGASANGVGLGDSNWYLVYFACPACNRPIIRVRRNQQGDITIYPAFPQRPPLRPVPAEVPNPYRQDFLEACDVLELSPKASAALSRRNLQAILKDKAGMTKRDLADQIAEMIERGHLPTHIQEGLDAVRNIGNFCSPSN
jgi:hypothetical protein